MCHALGTLVVAVAVSAASAPAGRRRPATFDCELTGDDDADCLTARSIGLDRLTIRGRGGVPRKSGCGVSPQLGTLWDCGCWIGL